MKSLFVAGYFGKGFGGSLIQWFDDRPFSHVSLVLMDGSRQMMEFESIQGVGVHSKPFDARSFHGEIFEIPATQEQINIIIDEAIMLQGSEYDWSGILGFLVRRKRQNDSKWFCSEYVAHCCAKAGIMLQRMHHWKQTPGMVCASPVLKPFMDLDEWRV